MDKQRQLDTIAKEIENCKICKVGKIGIAVPGEGDPDADIVFIGEAPGKQEAVSGRPFIGRSGQLLRSLIREIGLKEEGVYITSPVKYLPDCPARNARHIVAGGGTPTSEEIAHGRTHLMEQLKVIQPKIIVLLGRVAAEGVLKRKVAVVKERGKVIEEKNGVKYFLTYHPAAALRFPNKFLSSLTQDFFALQKLLLP